MVRYFAVAVQYERPHWVCANHARFWLLPSRLVDTLTLPSWALEILPTTPGAGVTAPAPSLEPKRRKQTWAVSRYNSCSRFAAFWMRLRQVLAIVSVA